MLKRFHLAARALAVAALAFVIAGVGAPYLRADYFSSRIQAGLEQSLGRKVKIGNARYNVFRGPGFQVEEVTIAEDPRIGIEPFAHVAEVQARVDVWSLFRGEIRFSNLRMVEPTVNFARTGDGGRWNIELFLERASADKLPPIQVRDGVVSFKFGNRKSHYYLGNADLDLAPAASGAILQLVASAEPFRSDQPARGVGRFHLRSRIANGIVEGELEGERTSIPEIARLLGASDPGLKGFITSNFRLQGPLQAVEIQGELRLDDLSGGVLLPKWNDGAALPVAGKLNVTGHEIELHSAPSPNALPVTIRVQAKDYLAKPDWSGEVRFEGFEAPTLLEVVKRLGVSVPEGFAIEKGNLSGTIQFAREQGLRGDIELAGAGILLPSGGRMSDTGFQFEVAGKDTSLRVHSGASATEASSAVEGKYDLESRTLSVRVTARRPTEIGETLKLAPDAPLLSKFQKGHWRGNLRYTGDASDPHWTAQVEATDAVAELEGLAGPVTLSFQAALDRDRLSVRALRGNCGKFAFTGDYRYEAKAQRPHKLNLASSSADLAELERILRPTLLRGGFFSKTLRIVRAPVPAWLAERRVEGTLRFAALTVGDSSKLEKVTAKYHWDGIKGALQDISATGDDGLEFEGQVSVDLAGNQPRYRSSGTLSDVPLPGGGRVTFEGSASFEGAGAALLAKMQSQGEMRAKAVRFNPEWLFDEVSGKYAMSASSKLVLTDLTLLQGADSYQGQASTQPDGRLALELTGGPKKQMKLLGSLLSKAP